MTKQNFLELSFSEFSQIIARIGQPPFRAGQVFDWIYHKGAVEFKSMTNLPRGLRDDLDQRIWIDLPCLTQERVSTDGTRKLLLTLSDGEQIETALIPSGKRLTLCVSSQVGCKFRCAFCASGLKGFQRHLTCSEIIGQVLFVNNRLGKKKVTHIVFMGIGEPLDNYEQVLKAVRMINSPQAFHIAARRITISTCGLIPQIQHLRTEGLQIELSISLHGYNDDVRRQLMPVSTRYALNDLIKTCRDYSRATKRQITFEYILIKNLTCSKEAAGALACLLKGLLCKINLIPLNSISGLPYAGPSRREVLDFCRDLEKKGVVATVRTPRGQDIEAACGQLRYG